MITDGVLYVNQEFDYSKFSSLLREYISSKSNEFSEELLEQFCAVYLEIPKGQKTAEEIKFLLGRLGIKEVRDKRTSHTASENSNEVYETSKKFKELLRKQIIKAL